MPWTSPCSSTRRAKIVISGRLHPAGTFVTPSGLTIAHTWPNGILFRVATETLITIAGDPKHLGARIGCTAMLQIWGRI